MRCDTSGKAQDAATLTLAPARAVQHLCHPAGRVRCPRDLRHVPWVKTPCAAALPAAATPRSWREK